MLRVLQLTGLALVDLANARWMGIPTVPSVAGSDQLRLNDLRSIIVDSQYSGSVNEKGQTLIPPTLKEFAQTFSDDLTRIGVNTSVDVGDSTSNAIFLTLGDPSRYRDAAGRTTSEGYTLSVSKSGINVTGASPLGVFWGTRTILQQAIASNGSIPYGQVVDSPGWATRGMMLDAGRHYYPPGFLTEMCAYMSFFKQNTFHLHLSDNLYNNVAIYGRERSLELYARFRLWSDSPDVAGLNKYKNESYTKEQFDDIQSSCAARGVTIVPEIEAPGHALVFVQWKPELGLTDDLSLLNISNPATIPTMQSVWSTFLPWFQTKTVHIGADEYTGEVNDYNVFVNAMADHIRSVSGKDTRIWGTFPPKYNVAGYDNIYQNVSVQHWEFFEDNPLYEYIKHNYSVLNSDDTFYVVNKWSGSYPQALNITRTFDGNPASGSHWYPYVFDTHNSSNNPSPDEALVLGAIAPLWNDYGANASVYSEAFYAWKEGIPALADKQWGGNLTSTEFESLFANLLPHVPGQNLERGIRSNTPTILEYAFNASSTGPGLQNRTSSLISDYSGNNYDGTTDCTASNTSSALLVTGRCSLVSPLGSKGRDYTLTLTLSISSLANPTNATLISGTDSALLLTPNITFVAGGEYFRLNSSLPLGKKAKLAIIGRGNRTFAQLDETEEEEFLTRMGINGERFQWTGMAFEAPLRKIGGKEAGWTGELYGIKLVNSA
ncbi:glycoside hydrolase family 20 protein [Lophiostoma macrostomum CBS 122681]|uniref:beta-N-acetylhexosaminidase n=1 Tax=Lophiostoma macrostomum CBS 122681 TaxID=1314788 RepID=A0A6A6SUI6_9PLEO|nr:glycoside hydrolase family 20 protein [Lophiostoma macrostomum CBS 122681]